VLIEPSKLVDQFKLPDPSLCFKSLMRQEREVRQGHHPAQGSEMMQCSTWYEPGPATWGWTALPGALGRIVAGAASG